MNNDDARPSVWRRLWWRFRHTCWTAKDAWLYSDAFRGAVKALLFLWVAGALIGGYAWYQHRVPSGFDRQELGQLAQVIREYATDHQIDTDSTEWPVSPDGKRSSLQGVIVFNSLYPPAIDQIHFRLPKHCRADTPGDVRTVVVLTWRSRVVGEYSGGGDARQHYCDVFVYEHDTGRLLVNRRFYGGQPPKTIRTTPGSKSGTHGSKPTQDILAFLLQGIDPDS